MYTAHRSKVLLSRRVLLSATASTIITSYLATLLPSAAAEQTNPILRLRQYYPPEFLQKYEKYVRGKKIPTICSYCAVGCGLIGTLSESGELIELEGDPYHPINEGALCSKGASTLQLIKSPNRILHPLIRTRAKGEDDPGWARITWDEAYSRIVKKMMEIYRVEIEPNIRKQDGYYLVGRDNPIAWVGSAYCTNEENYLFKKFMGLIGSSNIEHTARICHSTTVAALANTFGFGAMTNHWIDWVNAKRFLIIGANPAEQHPVSIRWLNRARDRGAKVIHLDPRYNRTSALADVFANFRPGSEIAIYLGIVRYVVFEKPERVAWNFLEKRTSAPFDLNKILGNEEVKPEDTLPDWRTNPSSIWSAFIKTIEPYTPEEVSNITGIPVEKFKQIAEVFTEEKPGKIIYSMGTTQHHNGTQNVRAMALLQLILGNVGVPGGGVEAERGISNVQGATDMNVVADVLMGYRIYPRSVEDVRKYQKWKNSDPEKRGGVPGGKTFTPANEAENRLLAIRTFPTWNSIEYHWGIYIGTWPGIDPDNEPVVCDLPIGVGNRMIEIHRAVLDRKIKMLFYVGANHGGSLANASQVRDALKAVDFMVCQELFESESAHYADILLPGTVRAGERSGSVTNSGRWIQWGWKIVDPPGEALDEFSFVTKLFKLLRKAGWKLPSEKFEEDNKVSIKRTIGGVEVENNPDIHWPSTFGETVEDVYKELGAKLGSVKVGIATIPQAPTNIIYRGSYDPSAVEVGGILPKRRDKSPASDYDAKHLLFKNWAYSWMDNQRNLYDVNEDPPGLKTFFAWWATNPKSFIGLDRAALWSPGLYRPGKVKADVDKGVYPAGKETSHPEFLGFPVHNEPVESPAAELVEKYPPIWDGRWKVVTGRRDEYPVVLTTFRLTEHMHVAQHTRNLPWLAELHPEPFLEISQELADELGVKSGDLVRVRTARKPEGIVVKALVTWRVKTLKVGGKNVHVVAAPFHWGFKGLVKGPVVNDLTLDVGDTFTSMPETKVCLCSVKKAVVV